MTGRTPPGFVFAIEGSRYLTHRLRFRPGLMALVDALG